MDLWLEPHSEKALTLKCTQNALPKNLISFGTKKVYASSDIFKFQQPFAIKEYFLTF